MEQSNTRNSDAGTGSGIAERVRESATAGLAAQKDRATEGLESVARAIRQSTHHLRESHHETIAEYVEKAADSIQRASAQLRERDLGNIVKDVEQFARRQPALFIGSAFALGVVGARFLKSSSDRRRRASMLEPYSGASPATGGVTGATGYQSGRV
jgi:hypothetical protein